MGGGARGFGLMMLRVIGEGAVFLESFGRRSVKWRGCLGKLSVERCSEGQRWGIYVWFWQRLALKRCLGPMRCSNCALVLQI